MDRIGVGRTAEVFAWAEGRALKLFRPGFEGGMQREYAVAARLAAMDMMAPRVYGTAVVDGRPGIVYARVAGGSMLQWIGRAPGRMGEFAAQLAGIQARIHATRAGEGFPCIKDWLLRRISDADAAMRGAAKARLNSLPDGDSLLHMDLHPDNVLGSEGQPVVIDWNNACHGAPGADVCRTLLMLRGGETAEGAQAEVAALREAGARAYLDAYVAYSGLARADLLAWMLPVAAARLADRIAGEEGYLRGVIAAEMARA